MRNYLGDKFDLAMIGEGVTIEIIELDSDAIQIVIETAGQLGVLEEAPEDLILNDNDVLFVKTPSRSFAVNALS